MFMFNNIAILTDNKVLEQWFFQVHLYAYPGVFPPRSHSCVNVYLQRLPQSFSNMKEDFFTVVFNREIRESNPDSCCILFPNIRFEVRLPLSNSDIVVHHYPWAACVNPIIVLHHIKLHFKAHMSNVKSCKICL